MRNYFLGLFLIPISCFGQQFDASGLGSPVDITGATGNCSANGGISFSINVSGVGTLDANTSLTQIQLTFSDCAGSGSNLNAVDIFLKAPGGTCTGIYDGGLSTDEDETVDFILTSSNGCLNSPNTTNMPQESGQDLGTTGSSGTFAATYPAGNQIDLTSVFNGVNADGTWTIIFSESTSFEPCIDAIQITFGDPTVDDQTGNGDNCVNPIVWDGGPICTTTSGMSPSTQMPGWAGPGANDWGTFYSGATCDWNFANNNDVWIAFVALETAVCINISGLDDNLQSVVISDPNTDGDNDPCTGANGGQYWNLESCPDPWVYTTTAGTDNNQNHCFTATIGQTYYLVVDGNGGAESSFYVSGISGTMYNLSVELINFQIVCENNMPTIVWETVSEYDNDYFLIQHTLDGNNYTSIGSVDGIGTTNEKQSYRFPITNSAYFKGYFRLKQVDYNGEFEYSAVRFANCENETPIVQIINDQLIVSNVENVLNCTIFDLSGRQIFSSKTYQDFKGPISSSLYYVVIETRSGVSNHKVFAY